MNDENTKQPLNQLGKVDLQKPQRSPASNLVNQAKRNTASAVGGVVGEKTGRETGKHAGAQAGQQAGEQAGENASKALGHATEKALDHVPGLNMLSKGAGKGVENATKGAFKSAGGAVGNQVGKQAGKNIGSNAGKSIGANAAAKAVTAPKELSDDSNENKKQEKKDDKALNQATKTGKDAANLARNADKIQTAANAIANPTGALTNAAGNAVSNMFHQGVAAVKGFATNVAHGVMNAPKVIGTAIKSGASMIKGAIGGVAKSLGSLGVHGAAATTLATTAVIGGPIVATTSIGYGAVKLVTYNQNELIKKNYSSDCDTIVAKANSIADPSTATGSGADWKDKSTKSYANAKALWDFWASYGLPGNAISGILGNIAHEGGFSIPDRAEGHFGEGATPEDTEKMAGISEGNVPAVGAGYPIGATGSVEGGGGYYQFTPYSKYAPLSSKDWTDIPKLSQFVWTSEFAKASWADEFYNTSSPGQAAQVWFTKYERGAAYNPAKTQAAQDAYDLFNGSSVKGDLSTFNKKRSESGSASTATTITPTKNSKNDECDMIGNSTSSNLKSGGMSLEDARKWMQDNYVNVANSEISSNNKYGAADGTPDIRYNCTMFSSYFLSKFTDLKGAGTGKFNGWEVTGTLKDLNGGNVETKPKLYAVFSVAPMNPLFYTGSAGHTGVVLGINTSTNKAVIGEANYGGATPPTDLSSQYKGIVVYERDLKDLESSGVTYYYTDGHLKI